MEAIEKWEHAGCKVTLYADPDPSDPRKEWDNASTMICWHRRYELGDEQWTGDEGFKSLRHMVRYLGIVRDAAVVLPLRLYDHGGITMSVGSGAHEMDPGGWDSGTVGLIYCTREQVAKEWGGDLEAAERYLRGDVATYDAYLTGSVVGYEVETPEGEHVDSCWGFYPDEGPDEWAYVRSEANGAAESYQKQEQTDRAWAAGHGIPTGGCA